MLGEWDVKVSLDNIKEVIKAYRDAGFEVIRMPITWTHYINEETNTIDEGFLDYVEYLVNLILDEGMYCMINSMRDYADLNDHFARVDGEWVTDWMEPQHTESVNARYTAIWQQVAERFRDYDEHLLFIALNEPQESIFPDGSAYDYQASRIAELNQIFVDTVRATGGNNATRTLVVSCLWGQFFLDSLTPPQDEHLAVDYHPYFVEDGPLGIYNIPNSVPVEEEGYFTEWSRENPTLQTFIELTFEDMREFTARTGVPVIIGETAGCVTLSEEDNIDLLTYMISLSKEQGVPLLLWDAHWAPSYWTEDLYLYHLGRDDWNSQTLLDAVMAAANAPAD